MKSHYGSFFLYDPDSKKVGRLCKRIHKLECANLFFYYLIIYFKKKYKEYMQCFKEVGIEATKVKFFSFCILSKKTNQKNPEEL